MKDNDRGQQQIWISLECMAKDMTNLIRRARKKDMIIRVEESWSGVYITWQNRAGVSSDDDWEGPGGRWGDD